MTRPDPVVPHGHGVEPTPLSPTAELTAVAAHLRRVADRVDDLEHRFDQLSTDTATRLAEHTDQVQQLLDTYTAGRIDPVDWPAMTTEQATHAWDDLAGWIAEVLVPWYEITRDQLPDCWALHRPAVTHLNWLRHTYRAAHLPGASPHLAAEWHTHWLPAAVRTLAEAIPRHGRRVCRPAEHLVDELARARPEVPGPYAPAHGDLCAGDQPAGRYHWQPFYDRAVTEDLASRRTEAS